MNVEGWKYEILLQLDKHPEYLWSFFNDGSVYNAVDMAMVGL